MIFFARGNPANSVDNQYLVILPTVQNIAETHASAIKNDKIFDSSSEKPIACTAANFKRFYPFAKLDNVLFYAVLRKDAYHVENIIDHRVKCGVVQYLVNWSRYEANWEYERVERV